MSSLAFRPAMLSTSVGGIGLPPSGRSVIKTSSTVREIVANENHGLLRLCVSVLSCGQSPSFQARYWMYFRSGEMPCTSNIVPTKSTRRSIGGSVSRSSSIA
jgi:hypothetical protein